MAENKKKSAYTGSRVADKKKSTKSAKNTKTKKSAPKADKAAETEQLEIAAETTAKKPFYFRREVWACVCPFIAFVACLSVCSLSGWFISAYEWVAGTLIGYGSNVLALVFMSAGLILLIKRHGKARLKVTAIMITPTLAGAIYHVTKNVTTWKMLGKSGRALLSGGLLAGTLGNLLRAGLSRVGALILLYILLAVCIALAFGEFIVKAVVLIKGWRPAPEPEEEEEPVYIPPRKPASGAKSIDVYEDPEQTSARRKAPTTPERKVRTPADVLQGMMESESKKPAANTQFTPEPEAEDEPPFEPTYEPARPVTPMRDPTQPITPRFVTNQAELELPELKEEPEQPLERPEDPEAPLDELPLDMQLDAALTEERQYMYPPLSMLNPGSGRPAAATQMIEECGERLIDTLRSFGVEATLINVTSGPTVTRFEVLLQRGIKVSKVEGLSPDIALALGAAHVRISAIPANNSVGIEIPNTARETVTVRDIISTQGFRDASSRLSFAVGKDIGGECVVGDISKMPHMLIAGTTGSGKSVCINTILISLLYKSTPEEVRLIMVDPKMVELKVYNGIPHLLIPVVTDPSKAAGALNWAVNEMMRRYKMFADIDVRDINSYNKKIVTMENGETIPRIVVVIDELSDLMVVAKHEVEEAIIRLGQMARAAGMHLIIATQRPSADVITGLMKANVPSRIAFAVSSSLESRIILDQMGAEKLIGYGDMLYSPLGGGKPRRIQGCLVTDSEVEQVVEFIKQNSGEVQYNEQVLEHIENHGKDPNEAGGGAPGAGGGLDADDDMLEAAIDIVMEVGQASTSMLQRRLKLGYARAARIIDIMEERGIVSGFEGSKPRQILISRDQWNEMKLRMKQ
ncbi:MAG: DNA translocase FtsK [Clostridia bacterium]|nr:DNA translocase FtsK [Clostridia bacterium]